MFWFRRLSLLCCCVVTSFLQHSSSFPPNPSPSRPDTGMGYGYGYGYGHGYGHGYGYRSPSSPASFSLYATFVDKVNLENWAVFLSSSISLDGQPGFTAITGETGSGKSMIIKALQYCAGKKKAGPLHLFSQPPPSSSSPSLSTRVDITMKPQELVSSEGETVGIRSDRLYSRVVSIGSSSSSASIPGSGSSSNMGRSSKSLIEIDGKRSTAKAMSSELSARIRFWPDDDDRTREVSFGSGAKRDPKRTKYLKLLDRIVRKQDASLLPNIASVYKAWKECYNELAKLEKVRVKMDTGNEMELLSFFSMEYDSFEKNLVGTVDHLRQLVDELLESDLFSSLPSLQPTSTKAFVPSLSSLADDIDSILPRKLEGKECVTMTNPNFLNEVGSLFQTADGVLTTLFSIVLTPTSHMSSSSAAALNRQSRLTTIIRELEEYSRDFEDVQRTDMGSQLGNIQDYLVSAVDSLRKASKGINVLEESVSSVTEVLEKMKASTAAWEMLAKKHQCMKGELGKLRMTWGEEQEMMSSIASKYPRLKEEENKVFKDYAELAQVLSEKRGTASVKLNQLINDVLPQLDMPEKTIEIKVTPISGKISSSKSKVRVDGWDVVEMLSISKTDDAKVAHVEQQFSSGEMARLALAIESSILNITLSMSNPAREVMEEDDLIDEECLLVCDEIDAHIGGEASNAAARLLRQIGRSKQVVAITHNPLIAAAAEKHVVVSRDPGAYTSSISELVGEDRLSEIVRMTTGKLDSQASRNLAKSLLEIDYI